MGRMDQPSFAQHPLTSGSVYGLPPGGLHIHWHATWTTASVDEVTAHFRRALNVEPEVKDGSATFRMPPDEPREVITVCRPETPGPHRNGTPIPPEANTVIVFSTAARGG